MNKPTIETQAKAVLYVRDVFTSYEEAMAPRKAELLEIYEAYSTFKEKVKGNWATSFKVNKAKEIIENVTPSLIARNPRWLVSVKNIKAFKDSEEITRLKEAVQAEQGNRIVDIDNLVMSHKREDVQEQAEAIQDYLTYIFEEYSLLDKIAIFGKSGIEDGKGYCEVVYKTEKAYVPSKKAVVNELGEEAMDENGEKMYEDVDIPIVTGEYPTIDNIDWCDIFYDTRILDAKDRPAHIRVKSGVRLADLYRYKKRYSNLDVLKELCKASKDDKSSERQAFKDRIFAIAGIQDPSKTHKIDENALTIKYFYGLFSPTGEPEDENLYKIATADDLVVVEMKKITFLPIEEWKCFPNTKNANAIGFVEPIIGLQEELNFKKNSAAEAINRANQKQRIWSANSGISPKALNDPIIQTTEDGPKALANIPEVPFSSIGADYFNEQNDFERQIQAATHTVDTANPRNSNSLTNTATGAKIKFYESNKVLDDVRRRFESALERLAYKFLQCAFENMSDNIVFKKMGSEEYWYANKELLRDAINKYQIKVEINSSSLTYAEDRRDESMAWMNILVNADAMLEKSGASQRVDFIPVIEEIGHTFEKKDPYKYLRTVNLTPPQSAPSQGGGNPPSLKPGGPNMTNAEELTKNIVGNI